MQPDITIDGSGMFLITGLTSAGIDWMRDNVADAEIVSADAQAVTDTQRYAQDIAEGATKDGLVVAVNGLLYILGGAAGKQLEYATRFQQ